MLSAPEAFEGSYAAVATLATALFITTWRTILPIRLGSPHRGERLAAYGDVIVLAFATGYGGGLESPFIFTVMIALVVVSFGWGYFDGAAAFLAAVGSMTWGVWWWVRISPSTIWSTGPGRSSRTSAARASVTTGFSRWRPW